MPTFLVIVRRSGRDYQHDKPVEQQSGWREHAAFMDALVDDGFIVLGGPLEDEVRVAYAVEAESPEAVRERLARDPWHESHLRVESIDRWTVRLDSRERDPRPLERLRAVYDEWTRGNYRAGYELYDPAMTLEVHSPIPDAQVYEGRAGLQSYMRNFLASWDHYHSKAVEFEDLDDLVLVRVHHGGTTGGIAAEMDYYASWRFADGRVVRVDIGQDREAVLPDPT